MKHENENLLAPSLVLVMKGHAALLDEWRSKKNAIVDKLTSVLEQNSIEFTTTWEKNEREMIECLQNTIGDLSSIDSRVDSGVEKLKEDRVCLSHLAESIREFTEKSTRLLLTLAPKLNFGSHGIDHGAVSAGNILEGKNESQYIEVFNKKSAQDLCPQEKLENKVSGPTSRHANKEDIVNNKRKSSDGFDSTASKVSKTTRGHFGAINRA